jgi:hypothetical protein
MIKGLYFFAPAHHYPWPMSMGLWWGQVPIVYYQISLELFNMIITLPLIYCKNHVGKLA